MCMYCGNGKCAGAMLLIAGVLLGLLAFGVGFPWYNLKLFFAVMLIIAGIHAVVHQDECCEMPAPKTTKKR